MLYEKFALYQGNILSLFQIQFAQTVDNVQIHTESGSGRFILLYGAFAPVCFDTFTAKMDLEVDFGTYFMLFYSR